MVEDQNVRRRAIDKLTIVVLLVIIVLITVTIFLVIKAPHSYFSGWAILSVYFIPRNILLFMSRYQIFQSSIPSLDFPIILLRIYGKPTITKYFNSSQILEQFRDIETAWDKFQFELFPKILRPILGICFWAIPYYVIFFN